MNYLTIEIQINFSKLRSILNYIMAALLNGKGWSYILGHFEEYTHAKGFKQDYQS
jgi:hypothetical protein